jgi:hypothetical protein
MAHERLAFLIEAGKKSQESLQQWEELHETFTQLRSSLDPQDVDIADLGIKTRLEGLNSIRDFLGSLSLEEFEALHQHILENYLDGDPKQATLERGPKIIGQLWAKMREWEPPGRGGLGGGSGIFSLLLAFGAGLGTLLDSKPAEAMVQLQNNLDSQGHTSLAGLLTLLGVSAVAMTLHRNLKK